MSANNEVDSDDGDVENNTQKKKVNYIKKSFQYVETDQYPLDLNWLSAILKIMSYIVLYQFYTKY